MRLGGKWEIMLRACVMNQKVENTDFCLASLRTGESRERWIG